MQRDVSGEKTNQPTKPKTYLLNEKSNNPETHRQTVRRP